MSLPIPTKKPTPVASNSLAIPTKKPTPSLSRLFFPVLATSHPLLVRVNNTNTVGGLTARVNSLVSPTLIKRFIDLSIPALATVEGTIDISTTAITPGGGAFFATSPAPTAFIRVEIGDMAEGANLSSARFRLSHPTHPELFVAANYDLPPSADSGLDSASWAELAPTASDNILFEIIPEPSEDEKINYTGPITSLLLISVAYDIEE